MRAIPEELTTLVADLETFLSDGLKGENLSKRAKERREALIRRIKDVKSGFPQDFKDWSAENSYDDEEVDSNNDGGSLSERTDKDDEAGEGAQPVAAQDLTPVFKAGFLEKRRKDHSFFSTEWQKRWCALSNQTFYYYGSEKDKQQKGDFGIEGYDIQMTNVLRKDSKKDFCFEISAPDKRVYQFCASSQREAEDWVEKIDLVLKDIRGSGIIPLDNDEYDDIVVPTDPTDPIDEDIYEELPEEDMPPPPMPTLPKPPSKVEASSIPPLPVTAKNTDYPNFYQGLWDCTGDHPDELSFKRGDPVYILSKEYQNYGWWVGEIRGSVGIVPKDYLMELYAM